MSFHSLVCVWMLRTQRCEALQVLLGRSLLVQSSSDACWDGPPARIPTIGETPMPLVSGAFKMTLGTCALTCFAEAVPGARLVECDASAVETGMPLLWPIIAPTSAMQGVPRKAVRAKSRPQEVHDRRHGSKPELFKRRCPAHPHAQRVRRKTRKA